MNNIDNANQVPSLRIPFIREWDKLMELTSEDNIIHWDGMSSWVHDDRPGIGETSTHEARGFMPADRRSYPDRATQYQNVGFRPVVDFAEVPVDAKTGDVVVMGTLYMDGNPVRVPENPKIGGDILGFTPGAKLKMGPMLDDPAYQMKGILLGDSVLVADRVMLKNISYEDILEATPDGDWKKSYAKSPFPYHISSGIADSRKDGWFRVDPVLNQSETSKIEVRTENGTMVAEVSASSDYPGIWLYVTGKNGIDRTLALVEATDNGLVLRLYEKKNDENPTKSVPIEFPTMVAEVEMAKADFERVNRLLDIDDIESLEEDDYGAYLLEDGTAVAQNSRELLFSTEFDDGTKLDLYLCSGFTNYYTEPEIVKPDGILLDEHDLLGESLSENEEFVIDGINYLVNIKLT